MKYLLTTSAIVVFALAMAQRAELQSTLTGILGKGKARWRTRIVGAEVQGELQVEAENLRPGVAYTLSVQGIGSVVRQANSLGAVRWQQTFRTRPLPNVVSGALVRVANPGNTTILRGNLR